MPDIQTTHVLPQTVPSVQRDGISFDDLIERQPGWLLRSGIPLLFFATALFVSLASFIHYPDRLAAPFVLTTENPPINVATLSGGQITSWYVTDSQEVEKDEWLAYIDNPASLKDVETFATLVEAVAAIVQIPDHRDIMIPEDLQMGDMRQVYTTYVLTLSKFQHLLHQQIVFQKMNALNDKTLKYRQLGTAMERQLALFEKEMALAEKDYFRNKQLNLGGLVSDLDFEMIEARLLQKQQQHENHKSAIIQNHIEIEHLNTQILELKDSRATGINDYQVKLDELALQFRNEYNQWQKKYMVTAPIAGKVSISPGMVENRTVNIGGIIAAIVPKDTGDKLVARFSQTASGIGKIEKGNRVLLQLDAYPYKEYGTVETLISNVSLLPVAAKEGELVYEVTCVLRQPISSSTGKELPFRQKLTGTAQIITKDRSVMRRLLDRLLSLNP